MGLNFKIIMWQFKYKQFYINRALKFKRQKEEYYLQQILKVLTKMLSLYTTVEQL